MKKSIDQAVSEYREALLSITEDAQDSIEPHVAIATGIQFFSQLAFDMAPSEDKAREVIATGIDFAYEDFLEQHDGK
tara:strand:+ start:386 stop:616 length:231 start_codon:yes stop_codon:yes gene_type:complete